MRFKRCINHPTAWANLSGLCPACRASQARTPEDRERSACLRRAAVYVRLSLRRDLRMAKNARRDLRRRLRKAGCA